MSSLRVEIRADPHSSDVEMIIGPVVLRGAMQRGEWLRIDEFSSRRKGGGRAALQALRPMFPHISAIGIGPPGATDWPSWKFWTQMKREGLVDALEDDEGGAVAGLGGLAGPREQAFWDRAQMKNGLHVYTGDTSDRSLFPLLDQAGIGSMCVREEFPPKRTPYAFDNGAYRDYKAVLKKMGMEESDPGVYGALMRYRASNGLEFDERKYEKAIKKLVDAISDRSAIPPDFIVVPDVVMDAPATFEYFDYWHGEIEDAFSSADVPVPPLYFVVQNGMDPKDLNRIAMKIQGIFVGGDMTWKLATAEQWVKFAHAAGGKCHVGRIYTDERIAFMRDIGADSIDSATPLWSRENLARFMRSLHAASGYSMKERSYEPANRRPFQKRLF